MELVHAPGIEPASFEPETQRPRLRLHDELAVGGLEPCGLVGVAEAERAVQRGIDVAAQLQLRVIISDQRDHRHAEGRGLALDRSLGARALVPALAVGDVAADEAAGQAHRLAVDRHRGGVGGAVVDDQDAPLVLRRGGRHAELALPVAVAHGHGDASMFGEERGEGGLVQFLDAGRDGGDGRLETVRVGLQLRRLLVPAAEARRRLRIEEGLPFQELLDDRRGVGRVERETVERGERGAAGHGVEAEGTSVEGLLRLSVEGRALAAAHGREVGQETVAVGVPAPGGVDLAGGTVHRALEAVDIMPEAVVVPHLVAELVAERIVERDDAAAARAAVHLHAVGVDAAVVVRGELGGHVGMALLADARGAVQSVVGVVDAVRDQLLADALAHGALMPAALAGIAVLEHLAGRQHHFGQVQRGVLAHDELRRRQGLEVFAVRLGVLGEGEGRAGLGEHPDVDGVQEQLGGGADRHARQLAGDGATAETEGHAGPDPFRGQRGAPGVGGVAQPVVLELALAEPLPRDAFEKDRLAAGDVDLTRSVMDGRAVTGAGLHPHELAVEPLGRRQMDVARPATVTGLDLHRVVPDEPLAQRLALRVGQLLDVGGIVQFADVGVLDGEVDAAPGSPLHEVGRGGQHVRRVQVQRAQRPSGGIKHGDRERRRAFRTERPHQQESLAQADQTRLAVVLTRTCGDDLALGEKDLGLEVPLEIVAGSGGIEDQLRLRSGGVRRGKAEEQQCGQREVTKVHERRGEAPEKPL